MGRVIYCVPVSYGFPSRRRRVLLLVFFYAASRQYARTFQHAPLGKRRIRSTRGSVVSA